MAYIKRANTDQIIEDLQKKIVFLVGPRQVGKTRLAQEVGKHFNRTVYLNYDSVDDRSVIKKQSWLSDTELLILDELHKMRGWKNYLKGLCDTKQEGLRILVTGSARLEHYRRAGDSLAGRYFTHHLMPFTLTELDAVSAPMELVRIERLVRRGGFPEPLLAQSDADVERWRLLYVDALVRTDAPDLENIQNARALRDIFELLRRKVGSPISYSSLAHDVEISPMTAKKYVHILEALYVVLLVQPYAHKIARAIRKEPKVYFYDTGLVVGDAGARFENFVAVSLQRHILERRDTRGDNARLAYLRMKGGQEVDFAIVNADNALERLVEAKTRDSTIARPLRYFSEKQRVPGVQVVEQLRREWREGDIEVRDASSFLQSLA